MNGVLVTIIAAICSFFVIAFSENTDFYFVQINDTHWGSGDNLERTKKAVDAINALSMEIRFVVHTGDIIDSETVNQTIVDSGLAIMRLLRYPV